MYTLHSYHYSHRIELSPCNRAPRCPCLVNIHLTSCHSWSPFILDFHINEMLEKSVIGKTCLRKSKTAGSWGGKAELHCRVKSGLTQNPWGPVGRVSDFWPGTEMNVCKICIPKQLTTSTSHYPFSRPCESRLDTASTLFSSVKSKISSQCWHQCGSD